MEAISRCFSVCRAKKMEALLAGACGLSFAGEIRKVSDGCAHPSIPNKALYLEGHCVRGVA